MEDNGYSLDCEPKLYISEIKKGSIDIYLNFGEAITLLSYCNTAVDFTKHIIDYLSFFTNKKEIAYKISKKDCESIIDFTDITARDINGNLGITLHGDINVTYNITSVEASAAQNNAIRYINEVAENKRQDEFEKMKMYWADANFISNKQHGKVIIEEISDKPKNALFLEATEKIKCTARHPNYQDTEWQNLLYIVDVKALYVNDKLKGYEILKVYDDVLPLDDD